MKKVEYKGKCYKCLKDLCKELNLVYTTIFGRLKSGYSIEEAVNVSNGKRIKHCNSKIITYKGKEYSSIKNFCEDMGLPYGIISARLRKGDTLEEAISKPERFVKVEYKGAERLRFELCKEHNISVATFRSRIKSGYSVEESLQKEFIKKCIICNKEFVSERPDNKYCSKTCFNRGGIYGKGAYKAYEYTCVVCGKTFITTQNKDECKTHTCSKNCRNQLARIDRNKKFKSLKAKNLFDYSVTLGNVYKKFGGICICCNKKLSFEENCNSNNYPSIDHIIPLSKGGTHTWDNVQLMCRGCNIAKSNKL